MGTSEFREQVDGGRRWEGGNYEGDRWGFGEGRGEVADDSDHRFAVGHADSVLAKLIGLC